MGDRSLVVAFIDADCSERAYGLVVGGVPADDNGHDLGDLGDSCFDNELRQPSPAQRKFGLTVFARSVAAIIMVAVILRAVQSVSEPVQC